jgi:hypothetical protein
MTVMATDVDVTRRFSIYVRGCEELLRREGFVLNESKSAGAASAPKGRRARIQTPAPGFSGEGQYVTDDRNIDGCVIFPRISPADIVYLL